MPTEYKDTKIANLYFEVCGRWLGIMSGALSVIFQSVGFYLPTSYAQATFSILAFVALWVCVLTIANKSYQLMKPVLKIEPMIIDRRPTRYRAFQIAVRNKSTIRNINNLEVELVSLDDEISSHPNSLNLGRIFPKFPKPEKSTNNINPGEKIPFTVFHISESFGTIEGQPKKFDAKYDIDKPVDRNIAIFIEKKSYRMKIAISAEQVHRFEQEFDLTVQVVNSFYQIDLIPISL